MVVWAEAGNLCFVRGERCDEVSWDSEACEGDNGLQGWPVVLEEMDVMVRDEGECTRSGSQEHGRKSDGDGKEMGRRWEDGRR